MGNRQEIKRKHKAQKRRRDLTPFIIIGVLVIAVLAIVIVSQIKPVGTIVLPERTKATQTDGLTMGDPKAKVQVIEFADFQCPACGSYWSQLEPTIISQYIDTGKAFFTYSPFSFLGQGYAWDESVKAAEAAYCANDQGKFWEYRDILFANQKGENGGAFSEKRLVAFANKLGLDQATFKDCLSSGQHNAEVTAATAFASSKGADYTPSFLVNGTLVNAGELTAAIENAMK
jgi:protein-disulfide isomerase